MIIITVISLWIFGLRIIQTILMLVYMKQLTKQPKRNLEFQVGSDLVMLVYKKSLIMDLVNQ
ncbi:MAG: hypothetical protein CMF72_00020 [Mameliella sp.]|nr:hypothetical protein [Mameliella sp.]